jgi:cell division transport system permease protein
MSKYWSHVVSLFRRSLRPLLVSWRSWSWAALVTSITAAIAIIGSLGARGFGHWTQSQQRGASMVVYLQPDVSDSLGQQMASDLQALTGVEHAFYVSAAESERRLRTVLSGSEPLLDGIEANSLPASVELRLQAGVRDVIEISEPYRALMQSGLSDEVEIVGEVEEQSSAALNQLGQLAGGCSLVLAALAMLITFVMARICLPVSRSDLAMAQMLGASPVFLRMPAIVAGAMFGALTATIAVAIVTLLQSYAGAAVQHWLATAVDDFALPWMSIAEVFYAIALLAGCGSIGGLMAGESNRG